MKKMGSGSLVNICDERTPLQSAKCKVQVRTLGVTAEDMQARHRVAGVVPIAARALFHSPLCGFHFALMYISVSTVTGVAAGLGYGLCAGEP
jgi:hypothetical protein